jgi:hypothetical protein
MKTTRIAVICLAIAIISTTLNAAEPATANALQSGTAILVESNDGSSITVYNAGPTLQPRSASWEVVTGLRGKGTKPLSRTLATGRSIEPTPLMEIKKPTTSQPTGLAYDAKRRMLCYTTPAPESLMASTGK